MYTEIKAKVHRERPEGTYLHVLVPAQSVTDELKKYSADGIMPGTLWIDDGRTIRAEQRRKAWATLGDISLWNGDDKEVNHWWLKTMHTAQSGEPMFSLADCSVTTARHYISFLLDFALAWSVPLSEPLLRRTDCIDAAVYSSLMHKRCIVCGREGECHHVDRIGIGRNRREIPHLGMLVMCLCRQHHDEVHLTGQGAFDEAYKIYGIAADEAICRVYRLKAE